MAPRVRPAWLLAVVLLGLLGLAGLTVTACRAGQTGLEAGRLRPCPERPNCVCSETTGDSHSIAPLGFEGNPRLAFASLLDFLRAEPRVELVIVEDDYARAVFKTALLRFRDDVEFRLDAQARVIHVRSASRIGYSDLGKNRARIESIRARWRSSRVP